MQSRNETVFVTGADQAYWRCLYQLLLAVERRGWRTGAQWIAYDLGMDEACRNRLETRFGWCTFRDLDLEGLPPHYVPSFGSYAWKPHVMWQVIRDAAGPVIWMDSANIPIGKPDTMIDWIRAHGLYILRGQTSLVGRCDQRMLEAMDVPRWIWGSRECASGLVGFDAANPLIRRIAEDWAKHAENSQIIRPTPDTFDGHRNDQSVLNALIQPLSATGQLTLPDEDIDISSGQPVRFISTRNKLRPTFPVWADPLARAWYRIAKSLDQAAIRSEAWLARRLGRDRFASGRTEVRFRAEEHQSPTTLKAPLGHRFAAPCAVQRDGRDWVFFEGFSIWSGQSTIAAAALDTPQDIQPALDTVGSAAFPYLFWHHDRLFMLTENPQATGLDIHECNHFPNRWTLRAHILDGVDATGSVLFSHDGRWWLFTSIASPQPGEDRRYLGVFHADTPVDGNWQAHPVNTEGRGITLPPGTGRNAGGIIRDRDRLLRVVHGPKGGLEFREVLDLTPDSFSERVVSPPLQLPDGAFHISQLGGITIWCSETGT